MSQARPVTRVCGFCRRTRLPGDNPGPFRDSCERALSGRHHLVGPDTRANLTTWDAGPMRDTLDRLGLPAVLVIYRPARLSRRELAKRTGVPEDATCYPETGARQGIYGIRQLQQFPDLLGTPRPALLPVILGQLSAFTGLAAASAEGASRG